ncbi:hypothetical protein L195_g026214 [Trifolium pratense]|uniref:Uncharacterized protein n=1 Tax=Trifolium pratense TaxID=57577 RepID=A0A2K3NIP7_TRIPR|nr:hypothetical protein L195_g026214 [Trifolium pratense]
MSFNASWTKQLGLRPNEPWGKREGGEKGAREREKELEIKEESLIIIDLSFLDWLLRHAQLSVSSPAPCAANLRHGQFCSRSAGVFPDFCAMRSSQQTGKSTVDLKVDVLTAFAPGTYFT